MAPALFIIYLATAIANAGVSVLEDQIRLRWAYGFAAAAFASLAILQAVILTGCR